VTHSTDANTFLGAYPFRDIGASDASDLLRTLEHVGVERAWISSLPAAFWRNPAAGNDALYAAGERYAALTPVPAAHPGLPQWEDVVREAALRGLPAVRCDAGAYGLAAEGPEVRALLQAAGTHGLLVVMAVRFEDGRQRHPNDKTPDLTPAAVRQMIRSSHSARLLITHADREFVEQVHFGATPAEARRILWDISCIWGPPEDHLALLLDTVGDDRFTLGSGAPLRLADAPLARIDLLNPSAAVRSRLLHDNLEGFVAGR
jgi:hypothetical protein